VQVTALKDTELERAHLSSQQ